MQDLKNFNLITSHLLVPAAVQCINVDVQNQPFTYLGHACALIMPFAVIKWPQRVECKFGNSVWSMELIKVKMNVQQFCAGLCAQRCHSHRS